MTRGPTAARRPQVLGHRGSPLRHPENTVEAFLAAIAEGADGVELDVRRAADDSLPVHHDQALTDGRRIAALRRDELPDSVPELAEVLDACSGSLVNIELKSSGAADDVRLADRVLALLSARGGGDTVLISSFDPQVLHRVHALAPAVATALVAVEIAPADLDRRSTAGDVAVHPHERTVSADFVAAAHALGLRVNAWTTQDTGRIRELADYGVDAVITDDPALAVRTLRS